jgi:hypothetical protein
VVVAGATGERTTGERTTGEGATGERTTEEGTGGQKPVRELLRGGASEEEIAKAKAKADQLAALQINPNIQNLYKLLVIKNVLGVITWYTLAGVLVSSVSYNYIINMSCDKSLEEITADLNNAEAASLEYAQGSG